MSHKIEGLEVTRRAESEVRLLIEKAAREGSYQDISDLAALAQGLAELRIRFGDTPGRIAEKVEARPPSRSDSEAKTNAPSPHIKRGTKPSTKKVPSVPRVLNLREDGYPRFLRDEDKLVKVGWSERDATTYEHRSPVAVVRAVIQKIERLAKKNGTFRMEEVLPLQINGSEIPSYQAYMALACLRKSDIVGRSNKNSYVVRNSSNVSETFDQLWKSLPTVASERKEMARE